MSIENRLCAELYSKGLHILSHFDRLYAKVLTRFGTFGLINLPRVTRLVNDGAHILAQWFDSGICGL